jgi:hypothetical protein
MPYTTVIIFAAYDILPAADLNSNFSNLDYLNTKINSQFILPVTAMSPVTAGPPAFAAVDMVSNGNLYNFLDFADGSFLAADIVFPMPADYNGGTITAQFYWTANSTSGNSVLWGIYGVSIADNEALDVAFGTPQTVLDANKTTAYKLNISDATPAVTIAGSPVAGELVCWRIVRSGADPGDTLAATARLLAVVINYTRS